MIFLETGSWEELGIAGRSWEELGAPADPAARPALGLAHCTADPPWEHFQSLSQ